MKYYIDTEFNGFNGGLISLALVAEDDREFYTALDCKKPTKWVRDNVLPVLRIKPVTEEKARQELFEFLKQDDDITIISDWCEDVSLFCRFMIIKPGACLNLDNIKFEIKRIKSKSRLPHNALEDARALKIADQQLKLI